MLLAAWHLDTLGLKIQFTSEISHYYSDAYLNQTDKTRAQSDLDEIVDIDGRLQSLRDAITEMRKKYRGRLGARQPASPAQPRSEPIWQLLCSGKLKSSRCKLPSASIGLPRRCQSQ